AALSRDVETVADEVGARRGVGVSLGAGALLASVATHPARWERLVLALPSVFDQARDALATKTTDALADAVEANDQDAIAKLLLELQPAAIRNKPAVTMWVRRHAATIGGTPVALALRSFPHQIPVSNPTELAAFRGDVLVLAQRDDPAHPVDVAER